MKKDRSLTVLTIKRVIKDDKTSFQLKSYKYYPKLSLYKALYLSPGCDFFGRTLEPSGYCHPFNNDAREILGMSDQWLWEFTFVVISRIKPHKSVTDQYDGLGNIGMYSYDASYPHITQKDISRAKHFFEELETKIKAKKAYRDLKDSSYWGAIACIPKGWHHVKEGVTEIGDYYWDDHTHQDGHYTDCSVSFSGMKPGTKIENRGCAHVRIDKVGVKHIISRSDWWNGFIIRKNT